MRRLIETFLHRLAQQKVTETVAQAMRDPSLAERDARSAADPRETTQAAGVGIVFALSMEAGCFVDKLRGMVTTRGAGFHAYEGGLSGRRVVAIVSGPGRNAARQATQALLAGHRPRRVVSAGFAGGLNHDVMRNDILLATAVKDIRGACLAIDVALQPPQSLGRCHSGILLTADNIIRTPAEKRRLGEEYGALAVDMETFAVAELCQQNSIPFLSVRVISDAVDDELPTDIDHLMRQKSWAGRAGAVVGTVFRRPESVKELWQLKENALVASDRLGRVLEWLVAGQ